MELLKEYVCLYDFISNHLIIYISGILLHFHFNNDIKRKHAFGYVSDWSIYICLLMLFFCLYIQAYLIIF